MKKGGFLWRLCEILPGALSWSALILPLLLSWSWPSLVALYILLFDLYWLFRAFYMAYFMARSYHKMRRALRSDFASRLQNLPKGDPLVIDWKKIYHAIIFATFGEELETLLPSVESVLENDWPQKQKIIVLAGEERDRARLYRVGEVLQKKFADRLFAFLISEHPDGIAGELRGKGAGSKWAGQLLSKFAEGKGLNEDEIIVHIADADTRFEKQYFNAVTLEFVTNPNRHRRSYQPIPLYSNNIWQTTTIARLAAWGSSFWQMIEASRPWRLVNFSTHAYSLKMLREMDYWAVDCVNEDSRQFWRAYFAFDGDHEAVPIYLPVRMDAVLTDNFWTTLKNQYLQKRRWAYGVEHLPYIVSETIRNKKISRLDVTVKVSRLIEGAYTWATATFYLMFVGWLPSIFSATYRDTVLAHNFPIISRVILSSAWILLLISIYISLSFLPPRPPGFRRRKYVEMAADWLIMPISAIFFSSFPALEAQTRLMLGRYLGFWVTPKAGVKARQ